MLHQVFQLLAALKAIPWSALAHSVAVGVLAGATAGGVVGIGARLAMRVIAMVAGVPLEFTVAGTIGILVLVVLASLVPGICYALVQEKLPGPALARGLIFGLGLLVVMGLPFLFGVISQGELARGPLDLGRGLFAGLFLLFGVTLGILTKWYAPRVPAPSRTVGSVISYVALAGIGMVGVAVEVVVALLVYFGIGAA